MTICELHEASDEGRIFKWRNVMTKSCPAIYEDGVLRLVEPLPLENGAAVEVIVTMPTTDIAAALAEIAAMPAEADDHGFSGADHDRILYGEKGAK
jgi:predicted DNA-binding antitoxin AbrB/MazE fold protein